MHSLGNGQMPPRCLTRCFALPAFCTHPPPPPLVLAVHVDLTSQQIRRIKTDSPQNLREWQQDTPDCFMIFFFFFFVGRALPARSVFTIEFVHHASFLPSFGPLCPPLSLSLIPVHGLRRDGSSPSIAPPNTHQRTTGKTTPGSFRPSSIFLLLYAPFFRAHVRRKLTSPASLSLPHGDVLAHAVKKRAKGAKPMVRLAWTDAGHQALASRWRQAATYIRGYDAA